MHGLKQSLQMILWRRDEATRGWLSLSRRTRREVMRLARIGQVHPDPAVASTARRWADSILTRSPYRSIVAAAGEIAILAILYLGTHIVFDAQLSDVLPLLVAPLTSLVVNEEARIVARRIASM